jgi:hypothetical protein
MAKRRWPNRDPPKDRNHQVTSRLVRDHKLIVTEEIVVSHTTVSAKGQFRREERLAMRLRAR